MYTIDSKLLLKKHFLKWMLFEFYTPQLCRMMAERQSSLPEDFVAGWPSFIQESPHLSDLVLQDKIDTFWVKRALRVLSGYQACSVPLPAHSTVACKTMNLLSPRGEKLLHRLQKAVLHPPVSRTDAGNWPQLHRDLPDSVCTVRICRLPSFLYN